MQMLLFLVVWSPCEWADVSYGKFLQHHARVIHRGSIPAAAPAAEQAHRAVTHAPRAAKAAQFTVPVTNPTYK